MKLPLRYAPYLYGAVQALITTAIASAISVGRSAEGASGLVSFMYAWTLSWSLAWLAMLPVVIGAAPVIQRVVASCIREDR